MAAVMGVAATAMVAGLSLSKDTVLEEAGFSRKTRNVMRLMCDGADIEQRDQPRRTTLLATTPCNWVDTTRVRIETIAVREGVTPLQLAHQLGCTGVEALLTKTERR